MKNQQTAVGFALLAAALYAINVPLSRLLPAEVGSVMMAAFLYLGAGLGLQVHDHSHGARSLPE